MRKLLVSSLVAVVAVLGLGGVARAADPAAPSAPNGDSQPFEPGGRAGIVGGGGASITTFPWMAAVLRSDVADPFQAQFCGGALIDPRYVLTAAHCFTKDNPDLVADDVEVAFGFTDLDAIPDIARRTVSAITFHPSYNDATREFDLAILTLTTPATGIATAAFAADTSTEGLNQPATIMGWGSIDTGGLQFLSTLKSGGIKVLAPPTGVGSTTCGTYTGAVFFPASQICGGVSQTGGAPDNCVFDDGGPMVVGNPGGWKVIGVTTDIGPCSVGNPSLYARVSAGAAWIDTFVDTPGSVGTYHAIVPQRIVDTRSNIGGLGSGYVGPQWTINPQVAGVAGVPLTGANGAVLNVTATQPNKNGWLTVFPTGTVLPTASNLNFVVGQTVPNLVTVKIGQAGKVSVANTAPNINAGSVHIIIDIVGWFGEDETGALFHSMAPNRIVDTRTGTTDNPTLNTAVPNATPIAPVVCGGTTGVDSLASAVVVNATVKSGSTAGWLTLWPSAAAPVVSNLNYAANQTIANLVIVKVGPTCTVQVGNSTGAVGHAPVSVILDVVGWFGPENTPDGGAHFHAISPRRIVDTRSGTADNARNTALAGQEVYTPLARNLPTIPGTAVAVIINLTATQPATTGFLTLYPDGDLTPPLASNLNFLGGKTVPNLAIVQVDVDDTVAVANTFNVTAAGTVHVVMDAVGWFE